MGALFTPAIWQSPICSTITSTQYNQNALEQLSFWPDVGG
ncbi:hypothetical protein TRM7615_05006 [Falsiruegeria mediterranea M17]|uniref:Uncharacterized protein n=1 Tax=Falsiruegeria mediterranea M17 TaxID=1200281 RepID=A0A2R8CG89_9RHOB|nr:hypothetical protein TRM7615_05006 [Falsiruegeria mediterranea M17]